MPRTEPSARFLPLSKILKERRAAAGLSQAQLAAALGWKQSAVADVEAARRRLNVIEFIDYARALGNNPVEIMAAMIIANEQGV